MYKTKYTNVSKCINNVYKCIQMYKTVYKCITMYSNYNCKYCKGIYYRYEFQIITYNKHYTFTYLKLKHFRNLQPSKFGEPMYMYIIQAYMYTQDVQKGVT